MQISSKSGSVAGVKADVLFVVGFAGEPVSVPEPFEAALGAAKSAGDLPEKFGESCTLYPNHGKAAAQKRVVVLSCGPKDEYDEDKSRRLAAIAGQRAEELGAANCAVAIADDVAGAIGDERLGICFAEGATMGAYRYDPPSKENPEPKKTKRMTFFVQGGKPSKAFASGVKTGTLRGESVCFARDLGNLPGNLLTPTILAQKARSLGGKGSKVTVRVLDEAAMKKAKMGALLGVSRGSAEPAKLIVLDYNPTSAKKTLCVVGKGLTFDAGGISLKPGAAMDEMRYDMCGGAAVLGLFHALAHGAARPKHRIVGVVASSENLPDGNAQKPGDVVIASNGVTIEVLNTDAEGRLILADALAYATKTYSPQAMVDLATLTGAVIIALGHECSAAIGNDDGLVAEILKAGESSGDRCWQLPLWDLHKEQMKSKFADLRNINSGKADGGGSIAGAAFLSHFVGKTPWVHLDIAGAAWGAKPKDYYQAGATGVGVRVLLDWISGH